MINEKIGTADNVSVELVKGDKHVEDRRVYYVETPTQNLDVAVIEAVKLSIAWSQRG